MTFRLGVLSLALAVALGGTALAQSGDASPEALDKDGRYTVRKIEEGYLRVDRETGEMTHCIVDEFGSWKCLIVPDDRAKYEKRIEVLKRENDFLRARQKALETRMMELEDTLVELRDELARSEEGGRRFLTESERRRLDKAIDSADRMLSRFSDLMKGLKEDAEDLAKKVPKILE